MLIPDRDTNWSHGRRKEREARGEREGEVGGGRERGRREKRDEAKEVKGGLMSKQALTCGTHPFIPGCDNGTLQSKTTNQPQF